MRFTPNSWTAIWQAKLSASVPPEVKNNSEGWQFRCFAIDRREVSIRAFEARP